MWSALEGSLHAILLSVYWYMAFYNSMSVLFRIQQDRCIHGENMDCYLPQAFRGIALLSMAGELSCPFSNKRGFFTSIVEAEEGNKKTEKKMK